MAVSWVGFEVLTAVSTKMAVFWVVAPCSLVEVYRRFKVLAAFIIRSIAQKTAIFILAAVRISDLKYCNTFIPTSLT
jgi:hypothetical protein